MMKYFNIIWIVWGLLGLIFQAQSSFSATAETPAAKDAVMVLSLEEALAISLSRNRNVVQSMAGRESAELSLDSTLSNFDLKLSPSSGVGVTDETESVNAGVTVSKKFFSGISVSGTPALERTDDGYSSRFGISLDIPLLKYYGPLVNTNSVRSSEFSVRNARRSLMQIKEDTFISTVTSYYQILELKEIVKLNRFLVKKFNDYAVIAKAKTDIGLAEPLDIYRSRIQAQNAQVNLSTSIEQLQNARYDLKTLLAIPQEQDIRIEDKNLSIPALGLTLEKAEKTAFKNSLEIKKAQDNLNEKLRARDIAKQLVKPDLKLSFRYSVSGDSDQFSTDLIDAGEDTWGLFLVSSTDFQRKTEKNNYRRSLLNVSSAKLSYEETRDRLSKTVRGRLDTLKQSRDRIGIIEKKIHDTTGKLKLASIKFDNGLSGNFDMIEAQTELNQASVDLVRAKINYITNTYRLRKTMGTLIQYDE